MVYAYGRHQTSLISSLNHDSVHQSYGANQRLYPYNHEPISSNSPNHDILSILILLFFVFLIVISLSQILVVHTSRYGANFSPIQKIQQELNLMDDSMKTLLHKNALPIDKWRLLFQIQTYFYRFKYLVDSFKMNSNFKINRTKTKDLNKITTNITRRKLFNKSNEFLLYKNNNEHLMNNIDRLKITIDEDQYEYRQTKTNKQKVHYCSKEPRSLRKSEERKNEQ